jgi:predicted glycogen debranching enzyme
MPAPTPPSCTFTREGPAPGGGGAASLHSLTNTEWLLTAGNGGFAMGTASGIPTRRYHGLLIASLRPPVNRVMALSAISETVSIDGARFDLANFHFNGGITHPHGFNYLERFEKDSEAGSVRWRYRCGAVTVVKSLHRLRQQPAAVIHYQISNPTGAPIELSLQPLVALRDFHGLLLRDLNPNRFTVTPVADAAVSIAAQGGATLTITADAGATFTRREEWWYNFSYPIEASRGYDHLEDLFSPGSFAATIPPGDSQLTLHASLGGAAASTPPLATLEQASRDRLQQILTATRHTLGPAFFTGGPLEHHPLLGRLPTLVAAADAFVIRRVRPGALPGAPADRVSIIAGYPWFADWGRDSMISLPGLLLSCGRFAEARAVLETFAAACKDGLIPNVFDDYNGTPHYNTVDASLWFIHAACQYLADSGDTDTFNATFYPACVDIVEHYQRGTHFSIKMDDADGLVRAGDATTQLTWMDAKRDGVVFTPRHGKPVEINALWYNALRSLADAVRLSRPADAARFSQLASRVATSFSARFWNEQRQCLFDVIGDDGSGTGATEIRPNQLFAVSLPHSPLDSRQQRAVVKACTDALYTPHGVRTLEPGDWRYKGRFRGRMFDRDAAYHNGTAWPWLLGPLAEATARADGWSPQAIKQARRLLAPSLASLDTDCCGQIPEVYDGDDTPSEPQQPGACPAQAWSVAELLRVSIALARAEA